jgi:hypothetical protein
MPALLDNRSCGDHREDSWEEPTALRPFGEQLMKARNPRDQASSGRPTAAHARESERNAGAAFKAASVSLAHPGLLVDSIMSSRCDLRATESNRRCRAPIRVPASAVAERQNHDTLQPWKKLISLTSPRRAGTSGTRT